MQLFKYIKSLPTVQRVQKYYSEKYGYVSTLKNTLLYSDYLKVCAVKTLKTLDTSKESISKRKIKAFRKDLSFKYDALTDNQKKKYEQILEEFDYSRSIHRKKLDLSTEGIYSPDFFRNAKQSYPLLKTNLNPTKDSFFKSRVYHNAAYLCMKEKYEIPPKLTVDTNFKNKWIKDYFLPPESSSFLLNNLEGYDMNNDNYKFWRSDKKHSYLKALVPHDKLPLFSKVPFIFKGIYISVRFVPDFHPEVFLFKRSSPSISVMYKHPMLRPSTAIKTEKIFRRIFWNAYKPLREAYKIDTSKFRSVFGEHEIIPEGYAKEGFYLIQVNKTCDTIIADLPKVQAEMDVAMTMVANLEWKELINSYENSMFSIEEIDMLNRVLFTHNSPITLVHSRAKKNSNIGKL